MDPDKSRNQQGISESQDRAGLSAAELTLWWVALNFPSRVASLIQRCHRPVAFFLRIAALHFGTLSGSSSLTQPVPLALGHQSILLAASSHQLLLWQWGAGVAGEPGNGLLAFSR